MYFYHINEKFTFGKSLNIGFTETSGQIIISLSACFPKNNEWLKNIINPLPIRNGIVYGCQSLILKRCIQNLQFRKHGSVNLKLFLVFFK